MYVEVLRGYMTHSIDGQPFECRKTPAQQSFDHADTDHNDAVDETEFLAWHPLQDNLTTYACVVAEAELPFCDNPYGTR